MQPEPDFSAVASLIGDPTRAAVLSMLFGGLSLPAGELARRAFVTPQTMSLHLAKLVDGGLLKVNRSGRHRYYGIKDAEVAAVLESLTLISQPPRTEIREISEEHRQLCFARTCYDHLAGKLGVMLMQSLVEKCFIAPDGDMVMVTLTGREWLARWNIDEAELRKKHRKFACTCIDWSERREHLAGALGASLTAKLFEKGWLKRRPDGRAVRVTAEGKTGFRQEFGILAAG